MNDQIDVLNPCLSPEYQDVESTNSWTAAVQGSLQSALHIVAPFTLPVAYLWSATQHGRTARKNIEHSEKLEENRQEFELRRLKLQSIEQKKHQTRMIAGQYLLQKDNQKFQNYLSNKRFVSDVVIQERRLAVENEREKKRLFVQWCIQENQHGFLDQQAKKRFENETRQADIRFERDLQQASLSMAHQQELERFRQECSRATQEWLFEQRRILDWEMKKFDRETQMMVCDFYRGNLEQTKILENYPLDTYFTPILKRYSSDYSGINVTVPPIVFFSPPVVKDDPRIKTLAAPEFRQISERIQLELSDFLRMHYDLITSKHPVWSQVTSWKTKSISLDTSATLLFDTFRTIPVIIIDSGIIPGESKPEQDFFYLRLIQWDAGDVAPSRPIGDMRFPWRSIPNISSFLSALHRICVGLLIDEYYLVHYGICPKLPEVLNDLVREMPDETAQKLLNLVISRYRSILEEMRNYRPTWVPQLALELADVLSQLPNQSWARSQVQFSIETLESLTMDIEGEGV
jgi:hypothetical protein